MAANAQGSSIYYFALSLIPGKKGHTSAEQVEDVDRRRLMTEGQDENERFGVMFHEICHSLYAAQSPGFQHDGSLV